MGAFDALIPKFLKRVALATVLGAGSQLAVGSRSIARERLRNFDVQPTITVRPGWPLRVIVHKDLVPENANINANRHSALTTNLLK
jgi:hypothetical protein